MPLSLSQVLVTFILVRKSLFNQKLFYRWYEESGFFEVNSADLIKLVGILNLTPIQREWIPHENFICVFWIPEKSIGTIRPTKFNVSRNFTQVSGQLLRLFLFTLTAEFLKRTIYTSESLYLLFILQPTQSFTITVSFIKLECQYHPHPFTSTPDLLSGPHPCKKEDIVAKEEVSRTQELSGLHKLTFYPFSHKSSIMLCKYSRLFHHLW